jgi:hypothetical protein
MKTSTPRSPFLALLLAPLALPGCGPVEEEAGALGNGAFYYGCISAQDPSCFGQTANEDVTLPFPPEIAFGGTFTLAYGSSAGVGYSAARVAPVSADWFQSGAEQTFTALRVGDSWFVAFTGAGSVLDFGRVTVIPIASITIAPAMQAPVLVHWGPTPLPMPDTPGTTHAFAAIAHDRRGNALACCDGGRAAGHEPPANAGRRRVGRLAESSTARRRRRSDCRGRRHRARRHGDRRSRWR